MSDDLKFNPDYAEEITAEEAALAKLFFEETGWCAPHEPYADQSPHVEDMRKIMWQFFKRIRELEARTVKHKPLEWDKKDPLCDDGSIFEEWEAAFSWTDSRYIISREYRVYNGIETSTWCAYFYIVKSSLHREWLPDPFESFDTKEDAQNACQQHAELILNKHIKECAE